MHATKIAFDEFRASFGPARLPPPEAIANAGEIVQMSPADGLEFWQDGCCPRACVAVPDDAPSVSNEQMSNMTLWVVCEQDVRYAQEGCSFGQTLETGVIKHTNLTGGNAAYCGGEMIILDNDTIIINGRSRRYGPRSSNEMISVAKSFTKTGYIVWAMGYEDDTGHALPFGKTLPICVS